MLISGFTYIKNGFNYGVPFIQSILSILPICDEFIIAVGDSSDGTREAIEGIGSPKIKVIDTVWKKETPHGEHVFAEQTNLALDQVSGKWAFHLQADELIHEKDLPTILSAIKEADKQPELDGFIFPFLHFWGDYKHIRSSRRMHKYEIRLFKNNALVRSYRDSQGFRKYSSLENYHVGKEPGTKLKVHKLDTPVFHYTGVKVNQQMAYKVSNFMYFYGGENPDDKKLAPFNYHTVDRVACFTKSHPALMTDIIDAYPINFQHDKSQAVWRVKDKVLQPIEDLLHYRFGEYKNYTLIK